MPDPRVDLYLIIGRLQGILAYSALDLGESAAAMTHAQAAWSCAEHTGDNEPRAWVRGTQSLIARFDSDYHTAMTDALDGLQYRTRPSSGAPAGRGASGTSRCPCRTGALREAMIEDRAA